MTTEILVCVLCRPAGLPSEAPRPGRALYEAIQKHAFSYEPAFRVRPVECMSGCKRHCTVALQAPGKFSYLFGDLAADETSAAQVLACALMHATSGDGFMPREARPERLRAGILARMPSLRPPEVDPRSR